MKSKSNRKVVKFQTHTLTHTYIKTNHSTVDVP